MFNNISGFDHGVLAVRDLENACETYRRLGFTLTPRRTFDGWGTANHIAMTPLHFIELIGIVDPELFTTPGLEDFLAVREGLMALAFLSPDIAAARSEMIDNGLHPSELNELTINLQMPDGPVPQGFRWLMLPKEETPELYVFVLEQLNPANMRRPEFLVHDNGATGISAITVIAQSDPAAYAPTYERLFGPGSAVASENGLVVDTRQGKIHFVTLALFDQLYAGIIRDDTPLPHIAALRVEVGDRIVAESVLNANGIETSTGIDGSILVAPGDACGVLLEFV